MGSHTDKTSVSDEEVFADPGEFTVEDVVSVLARSTPDRVAEIKQREAEGQARKGIADWEPPRPQPTPPAEAVFSRERVLGPDGPKIAGVRGAILAGALHGDDSQEFTREQLASKVNEFFAHEQQEA